MEERGNYGLGAEFVALAAGAMTRRELEKRRVRIIKELSERKFTMSAEEIQEAKSELAEISDVLGES